LLPGFSTVDANGQSRPFQTSVVGGTNAPPVVSGESVVVTTRSDYELGASGNLLHLRTVDNFGRDEREFHHEFGFVDNLGNRTLFVRDMLGSTRAVLKNGTMVEWNDYYAYGAVRDSWSLANGRWKYIGKELDNETNSLDFGARHLLDVGVWNTIDPLWSKYPSLSPYTYGANNPFKFIDVDGRDILVVLSGWAQFDAGKPLKAGNSSYALLNEVNQWAASIGLQNYKSAGYASSLSERSIPFETPLIPTIGYSYYPDEILSAFNFILQNYTEGEKIVIYGYSAGGNNAFLLSELLESYKINVDLLITVDAANGPFSKILKRVISNNVLSNENYYQEEEELLTFSRGYRNYAKNGDNSRIRNNLVPNTNHQNISDAVRGSVIQNIKDILKPKKTSENSGNKKFWDDILEKSSQAGEGRTTLYQAK